MDRACQDVAQQELAMPLGLVVFDEIRWHFEQRRADALNTSSTLDEERYHVARIAFQARRFQALYSAWVREGDDVLEAAWSSVPADALASGAG